MLATKIKMKPGCYNSQNLLEIDSIYIDGCNNPGFYKKDILHDHLQDNPKSIKVNINPTYPTLVPAKSTYGEKYVRSTPNNSTQDNLLNLPREK